MNTSAFIGWTLLYVVSCFFVGVSVGVLTKEDPPVVGTSEVAWSSEPATRAECIPCNGEGHVCGRMCQNCKGSGTVPIRRLALNHDDEDEPNDEPDCQFKLHTINK